MVVLIRGSSWGLISDDTDGPACIVKSERTVAQINLHVICFLTVVIPAGGLFALNSPKGWVLDGGICRLESLNRYYRYHHLKLFLEMMPCTYFLPLWNKKPFLQFQWTWGWRCFIDKHPIDFPLRVGFFFFSPVYFQPRWFISESILVVWKHDNKTTGAGIDVRASLAHHHHPHHHHHHSSRARLVLLIPPARERATSSFPHVLPHCWFWYR